MARKTQAKPIETPSPFDEMRDTLGPLVAGAEGEDVGAALRQELEAAGGCVLFDIAHGETDRLRWSAALAFDRAEGREIAVVALERASGEISLEPAEKSKLPIAAIARSYAGLAETWGSTA
jgi:hypothetical protein